MPDSLSAAPGAPILEPFASLPVAAVPTNEVIKAMWAESSQGILDAVGESDFLREAELASLETPLRLIWGERDRLLPEGTLEFFRRALPRAKVILLPNTGHLPHLESARALNNIVLGRFDESQVFRIDHYLGKGPVHNMLIFRFANGNADEVGIVDYH